MLQVLVKLDRAISKLEEGVCWIAFAVIFVLLFVAVVFRYGLNSPFTWTEELVTIVFSWIVFLGASACIPAHGLLRVDAFVRLLPRPLQTIVGAGAVIATCALLGVFIWFGLAYALAVMGDRFPMLDVSFAWAFLALPVASCFALVHIATIVLTEGPRTTFMSVTEMDDTLAPGAY